MIEEIGEKKGRITKGKTQLHYFTFGNGPKTMLAFHGFGLNKESFLATEAKLGSEYTIYSFDLFFHGQSNWGNKEQPITKTEICELINELLQFYKIDRFSVMTYSLGGKIGLTIIEKYHSRVDKLIFIASDGLVLSGWYKFATGYKATRGLLKYFIFKPNLYFTTTGFLNKFKLVPDSTIRFAQMNMATQTLRRKVYLTWVVYRNLKIDADKFCQLANQSNIHVEMYFGQKDSIINMNKILKASETLHNRMVKVYNCSHSKVLNEYAKDHSKLSSSKYDC
jgi:pimeloyl-ACP methyl ester carboxylesterase